MSLREILESIVRSFTSIVTATVVGAWLYCTLFNHNAKITYVFFGQIVLLSLVASLPFFVYYTKNELNKRQMFARMFIHYVAIVCIILPLLLWWRWILPQAWMVAVAIALITLGYIAVAASLFLRDKMLAHKLNKAFKNYQRK